MGFFQPDPVILAFLAYKQIYLELVFLLALTYCIIARDRGQKVALFALALTIFVLVGKYVPIIFGLVSGPIMVTAGALHSLWGQIAAPLILSALLLISAYFHAPKGRVLLILHLIILLPLIGLWLYSIVP